MQSLYQNTIFFWYRLLMFWQLLLFFWKNCLPVVAAAD